MEIWTHARPDPRCSSSPSTSVLLGSCLIRRGRFEGLVLVDLPGQPTNQSTMMRGTVHPRFPVIPVRPWRRELYITNRRRHFLHLHLLPTPHFPSSCCHLPSYTDSHSQAFSQCLASSYTLSTSAYDLAIGGKVACRWRHGARTSSR